MKPTSQLAHAAYVTYFQVLRGAERLFGPGILLPMITPQIAWTCRKCRRDLPQFRHLRAGLPDAFWQGGSAAGHYVRMFRTWISSLVVTLFYDRLKSRAWQRRVTVRGASPQALAELEKRPVVIAFLHTAAYPILRYWLRAQGMPASLYLGSFPPLTRHAQGLRERADAAFGMEGVPHLFAGGKSLREAVRFLQPGRTLLVALEERDFREPPQTYPVGGVTICLNRVAFRLARLADAVLMPAAVRETRPFRFEISFGAPVPAELMTGDSPVAANEHLLRALWPGVESDPSSLTWTSLEAVSPHLIRERASWP